MKRLLLVFIPAAALAAPLQGFYDIFDDWDIACDNTGTCRIAGYQEYGNTHRPISILFTRPAGANAPVQGRIAVAPDFTDDAPDLVLGKRSELWLNGKSLGCIKLDKDFYGTLSPAQTQTLLAALRRHSRIVLTSGKHRWTLSDKGAAAAMLKADEFQRRLNTPSAWIRKGDSRHAVLAPQAMPTIRAVAVPQKGSYELKAGTDKHRAVWTRLAASNQVNDEHDDYCASLHPADNPDVNKPQDITVYPLNNRQVLVETLCSFGAYQGTNLYAVMDKSLHKVEQVFANDYGGHAGFDAETSTLAGGFKSRGLGDCWGGRTAVWNGKTFVKSSKDTTGSCRGFMGGAWTLPIWKTNVIR